MLVSLVDDLDGVSVADETIEFAIDGVAYEIDLSAKSAQKLRDDLEDWIGAARRVSGRRHKRPTVNSGPANRSGAIDRLGRAAIRDWARLNGHHVSVHGRIASHVIDAFHAAT